MSPVLASNLGQGEVQPERPGSASFTSLMSDGVFAADSCLRSAAALGCVLPFVAEHFYVFGAFLYRAAGTALHLYANLLDDIGIGEGGDVASVHLI